MNELSIPLANQIGIFVSAFVFSILSTLAGIGGGAIFIPLFILIGGLDVKVAIFLSLITMVGNSIGRVVYYFLKRHHDARDRFLPDYNIIRLFVPFNSNATYLGFLLNQVLPGWMIIILIILLMVVVITKTTISLINFCRERQRNNDEEANNEVQNEEQNKDLDLVGQTWWDLINDLIYIFLAVGLVTFLSFVRKSFDPEWLVYIAQFFIMMLFGYLTMQHIRIIDLWRKANKFRVLDGDLDWSDKYLHVKIAIMSSITGICSALLGIGGGLVMNPTMLHFHVHPSVMLATSGWTTFFSVLMSTIQYLADDPSLLEWSHAVVFCVGLVASCLGLFIIRFFKKNAKVIITAILDVTMILCAILLLVINARELAE